MKILSIDVGLINPGFVILDKDKEGISIIIYSEIRFQKIIESKDFLNYLISQNLDLVLIENQNKMSYSSNSHTMGYIQGFFESRGIDVKIVAPIANLRIDKTDKRRCVKKNFSVDLANKLLNTNFKSSDSDLTDAINLGLLHFHKLESNNPKTFINGFNIKIKNITIRKMIKY